MVARLRTAVVGACFVALLLAAPAHAAFPGANGKIAFVLCGTAPKCDIWVMNADGTGRTNLTNDPASNTGPAWSPDGRRIAFVSDRDDPDPAGCRLRTTPCNYEIYAMNGDGTQLVRLTNNPTADTGPAWSPDGSKIVFVRTTTDGHPQFFTMNPDGSSQARLTTASGTDGVEPSWSPDGRKILYAHYDPAIDSTTNIYSINADGTGITRVIAGGPDAEDNLYPDWAPSGARFAFTRFVTIPSNPPQVGPCFDQGSCQEIWTANADGTGQTRLSASAAAGATPRDITPAWSPDGTKIAFYAPDPPGGLWTMNPDGSGRTNLGPGGNPSWQPLPNRPPDCSTAAATPDTLWPPNNRLVRVSLSGATDPDGDQVTLTITGVTQDEPTRRIPDAKLGPASNQVSLRAKRSNRDDGRVYRIAFKATDGQGGECSGTATVGVPRRKNRPAVDSAPPSYDSLVGAPGGGQSGHQG